MSKALRVPPRRHTGRRRNEAARRAVLDAALHLIGDAEGPPPTVEAIAAAAGVGKQTIYRWWPTKHALFGEVLVERAKVDVPQPNSGDIRRDLRSFIAASFRGAANPRTGALLRTIMADAQHNADAADVLREFTELRRSALRELLAGARKRGDITTSSLDLVVDQVFGVLWYRLLVGHAALSASAAQHLADDLLTQLHANETDTV